MLRDVRRLRDFVRRSDASLIPANANQRRGIESTEDLPPEPTARVVEAYLETLEGEVISAMGSKEGTNAFGGSTKVVPKYMSPVDPAAHWTGADREATAFACSTNHMVELDNTWLVDVEPSVPIRTVVSVAARRMIDRIADRFGTTPDRLVGDTGYGSADRLGWLVEERGISPHIPV